MSDLNLIQPDRLIDVREVFGVDTDLRVPAFSERDDHVPEIDDAYRINPDVTLALHNAFLVLAVVTVLSSLSFWGLHRDDGTSVSGAIVADAPD